MSNIREEIRESVVNVIIIINYVNTDYNRRLTKIYYYRNVNVL